MAKCQGVRMVRPRDRCPPGWLLKVGTKLVLLTWPNLCPHKDAPGSEQSIPIFYGFFTLPECVSVELYWASSACLPPTGTLLSLLTWIPHLVCLKYPVGIIEAGQFDPDDDRINVCFSSGALPPDSFCDCSAGIRSNPSYSWNFQTVPKRTRTLTFS